MTTSRPAFSIVYSASLDVTVSAGNVGDVLIPHATSGKFVLATTANRGSRRSTGVALGAYSSDVAVEIQQTGLLSAAISGLSSGSASWARVSSAGRIERVATPSASDDIIGWAEADGSVYLMAGILTSNLVNGTGMPGGWYDVTSYGATGDGSTDDSEAIQDAIDAMVGDDVVNQGGTLYFPPGVYRCASDVHVYKQARLLGPSGGIGRSLARLEFDAGRQLILWKQGYRAGGSADGCSVELIDIWSSKLSTTTWASSTPYSLGDKVRVEGWNHVYLECIEAGTSDTSIGEPPYEPDYSAAFAAGRTYALGEIVRGTSGGSLITSAFFVVTTAGTSGGSEPSWDTTTGHTTTSGTATFTARNPADSWVTDGTVVWAVKCHSGIWMRCRASIRGCYVYDTTTAGITIRGNTGGYPASNANGWLVERTRIERCGMGVWVSGGDVNVGVGTAIDVESAGLGIDGNGGVGIFDNSFLGCTWVGCQVANTTDGGGPSFQNNSNGSCYSVFVGCYSENYGGAEVIKAKVYAPGIVIGGDHGASFSSACTAARLFPSDNRNFVFKTPVSGSNYIYTYLGMYNDGVYALKWAYEADTYAHGVAYLPACSGGFGGGGSWWGVAENGNASAGYVAVAWPGEGAQWPSGASVGSYNVTWVPGRLHIGPKSSDPPSIGFGSAAPGSGYYVAGSIVWNSAPSSGASVPMGWVCTATGSPGTWTALASIP